MQQVYTGMTKSSFLINLTFSSASKHGSIAEENLYDSIL
jgi:hypothetical protein